MHSSTSSPSVAKCRWRVRLEIGIAFCSSVLWLQSAASLNSWAMLKQLTRAIFGCPSGLWLFAKYQELPSVSELMKNVGDVRTYPENNTTVSDFTSTLTLQIRTLTLNTTFLIFWPSLSRVALCLNAKCAVHSNFVSTPLKQYLIRICTSFTQSHVQ